MKLLVTVNNERRIIGISISTAEGLDPSELARKKEPKGFHSMRIPAFGPVVENGQKLVEVDLSDDCLLLPIKEFMIKVQEKLAKKTSRK